MEQNTGFAFDADNLVLRGNFALEDGNFEKAEQFFEQALNFDAKCAEAYLGSFLVEKRCSSLENYIARRLQETAPAIYESQPIQKNVQHIEEMATNYAVEPHFTGDAIRKMYQHEFVYKSCVPMRRTQRKAEEETWNNHPSLIRAERFASGSFAQKLTQAKRDFLTKLDQRIVDAQTDEAAAQQMQLIAYEDFLRVTDSQVAKANEAAIRGEYIEKPETQEKAPKKEKPKKKNNSIALTAAALLLVIALVIGLVAFLPKKDAEQPADQESTQEDPRETKYTRAEECLVAGDKRGALMIFRELGDFKDAPIRAEEVRLSMMQKNIVSAGWLHTVGLKADGTVVATSITIDDFDYDYGQCNVSDWTDIVAISAGFYHTVGLKADGTVVATSLTGGLFDYGQCNISDWTDIVAISAGSCHTVGLKADGTVVATSITIDDADKGQCNVSDWTDIVAISAGGKHTVGLKADGTVVAKGWNDYGQCNVSGWTDIVAISADYYHTVGLKADGTVVAVGSNANSQLNVSKWTDIIAISAGYYHTVGLKADGTVVAVGSNALGQCDVSGWTDIVAISADYYHTVGLKADGTVVAVGYNRYGQCDVSDWVLPVPEK